MTQLPIGLYEALMTTGLSEAVDAIASQGRIVRRPLHPAETPDRIAMHLSWQIERALESLSEERRVAVGIEVARALLNALGEIVDTDPSDRPIEPGEVLRGILNTRPDGQPDPMDQPLIPLLDTTLLTNSPGEPNLWKRLRSEISSADRIDIVMAFVRRTGITPLLEALRTHCASRPTGLDGRPPLRVLTTTYTGSTERSALDALADIGAEIRVSYDLGTTRLHAKAWLFHRESGFSTAYVGSSNLTHSAQVTGMEWNVRASAARNRDVVSKFQAVFDSYWASDDYVPYDADRFDAERQRGGGGSRSQTVLMSPTEVHPRPFQARLLELIKVSRHRGYHRNLLVAATGTGKTVMAALDYTSVRESLARSRLLVVAHREEILDQAMATFRQVLRDPSFGEKWVGGTRPQHFEHVFASIQSLTRTNLEALPPEHFDVVIVDEFHHAAAASYERLLAHLRPKELLGLTATPERSDGRSILRWFDDRIAAELRLWDAIDQNHLVPFLYYGIYDGADLTNVPWRRGRGYDIGALSDVYTNSGAWARFVVAELEKRVDTASMRALGFCVSVQHAEFMADHFQTSGLSALCVSANTPVDERLTALRDLQGGRLRAVFSVDLFNEGVDVPNVDTVLMLRPTESPVLFLQQLGRGLRRAERKTSCTVLDFVGLHRREFRFDRRYRALLGGTRRQIERAVEHQFPHLPVGCDMQLDEKSREIVLRSIREATPTQWKARVRELRDLRRSNSSVGLSEFLMESGLGLDDVYSNQRSWSDLLEAAEFPTLPRGQFERSLRRAIGRMLHIDDLDRLCGYQSLLSKTAAPNVGMLNPYERRLVHMLVAAMTNSAAASSDSLQTGADLLWAHPQVTDELRQLFDVLTSEIDHLHSPIADQRDVPLQVHARYTRVEILAAIGVSPDRAKVVPWQSGVFHAAAAKTDLLAFTLDKSGGGFSPTTRYRDYALTRDLLHWESQSTTREDSETGLRYRNHERDGATILLFSRIRPEDRAFWFLGPARYVEHEGERPMAITWRLDVPLPGDLFAEFAAAVA